MSANAGISSSDCCPRVIRWCLTGFTRIPLEEEDATGTVMPNRQGLPKTEIKKEGKYTAGEVRTRVAPMESTALHVLEEQARGAKALDGAPRDEAARATAATRCRGRSRHQFSSTTKYKVGVDLSDQLEGHYLFARASKKCLQKRAFYILNSAVTNAYILFPKGNARWPRSRSSRQDNFSEKISTPH
jgi:hypothetical protein